MDLSLKNDAITFLVMDAKTILKDLNKTFERQIKQYKTFKPGFYKIEFALHIINSIKIKIREMFHDRFNINSEQAFVLQDDVVISTLIDNMSYQILNEGDI